MNGFSCFTFSIPLRAKIFRHEDFPTIRRLLKCCFLVGLTAFAGCPGTKPIEGEVKKKPRPIEAMTLVASPPPTAALVSASVASWKTEDIGFEVSGRVEWVIEPGADVEGRIVDKDGKVIIEGTPIARIEDERYRLQVDSAIAEVARSNQSVAAAEIEIDKSLPAQMRAAEAEQALAKTELERSRRLVARNAGAQADVDRDQAKFENAASQIEQLKATLKAKQAELESLRLQVAKAKQALRDAERSLEDCVLFSSFSGQISSVDAVPGTVVSAGQAIATIQMMDPIKVELEVSAEDSRRLRKRQRLPLLVTKPDGTIETKDGFLYLVDPTADPQTRTYTLTLLMLNERILVEGSAASVGIPITDQTWRMDFSFLPGAEEGRLYAPEEAIREDSEGPFLWRVTNLTSGENLPQNNVVEVAKLRVERGASKIPFLGNWDFQQVVVQDETFDPKLNLVIGKLNVLDGEPDDWIGDRVLVSRDSTWNVRPGDIVRVDLSSGDSEPGIFIPMDAIVRDAGKSFVFIIDEDESQYTVRRQEVKTKELDGSLSSLLRIEAVESADLLDGKRIATRGVHYLREGEAVLVSSSEASR